MSVGLDTVLYANASEFFTKLTEPELTPPPWVNHVIYAGLFDSVTPKTIWLAKRLYNCTTRKSRQVQVLHHP